MEDLIKSYIENAELAGHTVEIAHILPEVKGGEQRFTVMYKNSAGGYVSEVGISGLLVSMWENQTKENEEKAEWNYDVKMLTMK
jgi:hypothetical protein